MIAESTIYLLGSGASAIVLVALLAWFRRVPAAGRAICGFVAGAVGLNALANLLTALGTGTLLVAGGSVSVPLLVNDLVAYAGLFVVAGLLAGASRAYVAAIGAIAVVQRIAFELANAGYVEGLAALAAAAVVVGGWFVHLYLFLGPTWTAAQAVPAGRRLLHWKCRNLLLFLIGMLIVFAMLVLAGVFDPLVSTLTSTYVAFLIRAGLAGFIFANAGEIGGGAVDGDPLQGSPSPVGTAVNE